MGEISEALRRARELPTRGEGPEPLAARREAGPLFQATAADARTTVSIPTSRAHAWRARAVLVEPASDIAESYRHFAIRVQRALRERSARSVLVTSPVRNEGKTTTACNLALALASMSTGRRIALLELDLRRPSGALQLDVEEHTGVEDALEGNASLAQVREATQIPELDLYLARGPARAPLVAISSRRIGAIVRELVGQYDTVVIDSPPVLPVPDVPLILPFVDAVVLVARTGVSRVSAMRETIDSIGREKLVGVFLNERRMPRHRRYEGYYPGGAADPPEPSEGIDHDAQ